MAAVKTRYWKNGRWPVCKSRVRSWTRAQFSGPFANATGYILNFTSYHWKKKIHDLPRLSNTTPRNAHPRCENSILIPLKLQESFWILFNFRPHRSYTEKVNSRVEVTAFRIWFGVTLTSWLFVIGPDFWLATCNGATFPNTFKPLQKTAWMQPQILYKLSYCVYFSLERLFQVVL